MKNNCTLRKALCFSNWHTEKWKPARRETGDPSSRVPLRAGGTCHGGPWCHFLIPAPEEAGPGVSDTLKLPQPVQILEQFPWHRALMTGQTNQAPRSQTRKTSCRPPHLVEQDSSDLGLSFYIHSTISGICSRKYEILVFHSVHLLTSSRVNKFRVRQPERGQAAEVFGHMETRASRGSTLMHSSPLSSVKVELTLKRPL